MPHEQLYVETGDGTALHAVRWPGDGPTVVLLHAGVADHRSWLTTAELLAPADVVAYDRRGYGLSEAGATAFRHVDDLRRVLDVVSPDAPAWLVGSSMGGGVALDLAVEDPQRLAGLVLLAPAVSGAPQVTELDPATRRLDELLESAYAAGDLDEVNRLETWVWLDGPTSPERRVDGAARALALAMNAAILGAGGEEGAGVSGVDAWTALADLRLPTTVACGDLDVPFLVERAAAVATRVPGARHEVLPGTAHLPYLEDPQAVADVVRTAVLGPSAPAAP
jgi:pimeloyl-ACP methyl ester carboxylesterase